MQLVGAGLSTGTARGAAVRRFGRLGSGVRIAYYTDCRDLTVVIVDHGLRQLRGVVVAKRKSDAMAFVAVRERDLLYDFADSRGFQPDGLPRLAIPFGALRERGKLYEPVTELRTLRPDFKGRAYHVLCSPQHCTGDETRLCEMCGRWVASPNRRYLRDGVQRCLECHERTHVEEKHG